MEGTKGIMSTGVRRILMSARFQKLNLALQKCADELLFHRLVSPARFAETPIIISCVVHDLTHKVILLGNFMSDY